MARLAGKVAIVTGSASGIGRATARRFAAEGARVVVVTDKRVQLGEETASRIREAGGEASFVQADVAVKADVQRMVRHAVDTYGRLDILVNNAAWSNPQPAATMDEEVWDRTIDVCLKAAFLGAQAAVPVMQRQGGGAIINIGSVNGMAASPGLCAYNAAKGGINLLTQNLAIELGRHGIRVNAILPGHIRVSNDLYEREPLELWGFTEACPIGRIGQPEDIAAAAVFLASDDAAFCTGAQLVVDGGMTAQVPEILVAPHYRRLYGRAPVKPIDEA